MARQQLKTLTEPMYYLLMALLTPNHGYGIMQHIDQQTEGRVQMGAGTLYTLLGRFEKEEIIIQLREEERKKIYQLTEKGEALLRGEYERLRQLVMDGEPYLGGVSKDDN